MGTLFKWIIFIVWLIDILNIGCKINGFAFPADFLDVTIPLNFWFWLIYWCIAPDLD